jgi:signal peptidase I
VFPLDALKAAGKAWKRVDPAEVLKRKFHLAGWAAELADWVGGFIVAALIYFVIAPAILGAYPPGVVVQSCSMKGYYNVGDIVVLRGASFDAVNAPLITLSSPLSYTIEPNDVNQETKALLFPDGQRVDIAETGDVIVYDSAISGIQIIHRVVAKVRASDGEFYITKGDANPLPDSVRIDCAEWESVPEGRKCTKLAPTVSRICTADDKGWPGCLATPVAAGKIAGKELVAIPLLGHVKMLVFHILTLGHGYPDKFWC